MELAIDTSTDFAGIALSHDGKTEAELCWHSRQNHTRELMPRISELLRQSNITPRSLTAIFVALGPGSFNGLRVGLSAAKGLAFALNIPLVGIGTLEIEAYPFACTGLPIRPVHNAGRGEIATATYQQDDSWRCLEKEYITTIDALCQLIKEKTVFCGEIPEEAITNLAQSLGEKAIIPDATARMRHARYLAALAWQRLAKGDTDDAASLQPIYLRQPPITQRKVK